MEGVNMAGGRRQHTVMLDAAQSEALAQRATEGRRSFNEQIRFELQQALLMDRREQRRGQRHKRSVAIKLYGDEAWRCYRNASAEVDHNVHRLTVMHGERPVASYDLGDVQHWEIDEPDEED